MKNFVRTFYIPEVVPVQIYPRVLSKVTQLKVIYRVNYGFISYIVARNKFKLFAIKISLWLKRILSADITAHAAVTFRLFSFTIDIQMLQQLEEQYKITRYTLLRRYNYCSFRSF